LNISAEFEDLREGLLNIELLDLQGRIIFIKQLDPIGSKLQVALNIGNIPKGVAFVKLEGRGVLWMDRIIIH
jgi:hypothetical protein